MAKTYNRMRIDVNTKPTDIITEVQADSNSRYLDVYLYDGGVPIDLTGHEVRIYMRKPENSGEIWNNGEITEPTNGRCQFLLTTQALARVGVLHTQISIWKDNEEILSTQIFDISVTESLHTTGSIESSNEYGALVVLFQNLYEAYDLMTEMVQSFGAAGEAAQERKISTFWQGVEYLAKYMDTDLKTLLENVLANASVQGVLDRIGTTADTGGSATAGTVMGKENAILSLLTLGGTKVVKSVQQGTMDRVSGTSDTLTTIEISEVDPTKSVAFVTSFISSSDRGPCVFYGLEATKLKVRHVSGSYIGWQVIEFY